jgi:PAS domain S-box-containing protein
VAAIGVILSLLAFMAARSAEDARVLGALERRADWSSKGLENKISDAIDPLSALAIVLSSEPSTTAEQFRRLASQTRLLGIPVERLSWRPRVLRSDRQTFEAAASAGGLAGFTIRERDPAGQLVAASERDEYFPTLFEQTFGALPPSLGLDIAADPERRATLDAARDQGSPVSLFPARQAAGMAEANSYLIYWPVYAGGTVPPTVAERRQRLSGYVTALASISRVLEYALSDTPEITETIRFYAGDAAAAAAQPLRAVYVPGAGIRSATPEADKQIAASALRVIRSFSLLGQHWTVVFDFPPESLDSVKSSAPWAYLALALALTTLLTGIVASEMRDRKRIEDAVAARTLELTEVNSKLRREIEERERAEALVLEREQRFRDFAEVASDWYWESDREHRFTYVSQRISDLGGFPPEFYIGKTRTQTLAGVDEPAAWAQHLSDLAAHRPFRNLVITRRRLDGTEWQAQVSGRPVFSADGEFCGYRGVGQDVTKEVAAQQDAAMAHHRLVDAIDALPAGFIYFDASERVVLTNRWAISSFPERAHLFAPGTPFEALARFAAERDFADDSLARRESWLENRLAQFRRGDTNMVVFAGDGRWHHLIERRTSDGGTVQIRLEVTDLKRHELELEAAVRRNDLLSAAMAATTSGILITDETRPDSPIAYVNPAFTATTGYAADEVLGRSAAMLHSDETDPAAYAEFLDALSTRRHTTVEVHTRRKDGTSFWTALTVSPVFSASSELVAFILIANDITATKTMAEQLQRAQKMEVVGQLTGGVAHDFNNLLAVIIGNLELILESDVPEEVTGELVDPALQSALRGAELTHRLLAFSRQQPLQPVDIDLNKAVLDMHELLRRSLGEAISVETNLSPSLWTCRVDPGQIETALVNLAVNARDAMPAGGRIFIETANVSFDKNEVGDYDELPPGDYVALTVSDNGSGMPEAVRRRAFEPFFTTKEVGKGSGLGLSMVYGFIKQSGGQVTIYSEPSVGTTVRLYLPRSASGDSANATAGKIDMAMPKSDATILIVEDQVEVRAMAKRILTGLGFAIFEAGDAASALAEIDQHPNIDLLFTDIILPGGMNGEALAAEALRRNPRLKVLYTSGFTENALISQGQLVAGAHLLSKPYRRRDLIQLLNLVLSEA